MYKSIKQIKDSFTQEFGIHFKNSPDELEFALAFLEEAIHHYRDAVGVEERGITKEDRDEPSPSDYMTTGFNEALKEINKKINQYWE